MKIVKYDKGNGICLMYKDDYLNKLNAIVEDKTKFKLIEKDKRKNSRHPIIRRTEYIREMIKQNLKPHIDKKHIITLLLVVTRRVSFMARVKSIKKVIH